jgi:DUF971 family protein
MSGVSDIWPLELRLADAGRLLKITFDDGSAYEIAAELLRVESPSAEVKGHGPGQEQLVFGKRLVALTGVEPVGSYAVRLVFSDGHASGIFTWSYLAKLGLDAADLWEAYISKLQAAGKTRDP